MSAYSLAQLGWNPFFQQQLTLDEYQDTRAMRVCEQHRNRLVLIGESGLADFALVGQLPAISVGDWLLLSTEGEFIRRLDRATEFRRKAAGAKIDEQMIAVNVDTVFIVMSLNQDFKLSRVERYLTLVNEAGAESVVVLTKKDLCESLEQADELVAQVQALDPLLNVVALNALDSEAAAALAPWCRSGKTLALMGSSGVGKSTLVNTIIGDAQQATANIREDDSKGRHTTTSRSIHLTPVGAVLMDTPGMRELQLTDVDEGLSLTFADVEALAEQCRFGDCQHQAEPGCAIQAALASGELDARRFNNYLKLAREQALNSASLAEKRAKDKALGKMYRAVQGESRRRKKGG
ncbi:ribosome small subunit-dependent GTPase A [Paraferrimonas sedimenticola]|uniref:Small ribosomal subunit biogenesis GTPase RsgA n=1 Tax=Paraferrimonas sedimenticola TaxID=375674 RepID=A0AA37RXL1_9GAMM|nr:ribosome small subunit-dependent GTPase A [Paraferrimonas sedimenticola]GLP96908.1 putative ribosome biogenesis GTPase RsgA 2 [Paraferrimonas sedimenticola]